MKIIKPGMDSRQVIARFEAERQALEMMVPGTIGESSRRSVPVTLDRPYLVMEMVKGVPVIRILVGIWAPLGRGFRISS